MSRKPIGGDFFVIPIDRNRERALHFVFNFALLDNGSTVLEKIRKQGGDLEALKSFFEDYSDGSHENGWCDDPNCTRK